MGHFLKTQNALSNVGDFSNTWKLQALKTLKRLRTLGEKQSWGDDCDLFARHKSHLLTIEDYLSD